VAGLAPRLWDRSGPGVEIRRVVSSPLRRAYDTAAALSGHLPVEVDPRWIERDYGTSDESPLAGIGGEEWDRWRNDPDYRPPGGETIAEVGERVRDACRELLSEDGEVSGDVIVVSHVSPIKAAVCFVLGLPDVAASSMLLSTASVTRIARRARGPMLLSFNETLDG